jgi:hypothetical protein
MLVSTAISRIKSAGHDISDEYTNERCIEFLNTAIQQVSSLLISAQYPALVKEIMVHNGESLPTNYMKACGTYPLRMTNNKVTIVDDSESVRFRYWSTPELIDENSRELPYTHDAINEVIVRLAAMLALNENEYDIGQDSNLLAQLQQAIASGMA